MTLCTIQYSVGGSCSRLRHGSLLEIANSIVRALQAGTKRPAQATDATPQPAKQAKAAGGGKQQNSQAAAAGGTPGSTSAAEQSWAKDIQAHLKCVLWRKGRCQMCPAAGSCLLKHCACS